MKLVSLAFVVLLGASNLTAQQTPEWARVYTFDESIIEMNTSLVKFITHDVSRVRFRWTFDQPQAFDAGPQLKFQSRLEVMEFDCSARRYRPYHFTYFDQAGNALRVEDLSPIAKWDNVMSGGIMEKLYAPACKLVEKIKHPPVVSADDLKKEKAANLAFSFSQRLEQVKDFKPLIKSYFVPNYLGGYLTDQKNNWFLNLDPAVATKASRAELERYYVAQLNSGYLSAVYLISQTDSEDSVVPDRKRIPSDVLELIENHPYSAKYRSKLENYNFLADRIVSVEQLREYTDLLHGIAGLMRRHVSNISAEQSPQYQSLLEDFDLYSPKERVCAAVCLGLPKGTKLFEVNVPMFRLQLAEIRGKLRVVSARDLSY